MSLLSIAAAQVEVSDEESKERWDCETILTMNSTLYNHPRTITDPPRRKKIAVDPRTGIPLEHRVSGLTRRNLAHHDKAADMPDSELPLITAINCIYSLICLFLFNKEIWSKEK